MDSKDSDTSTFSRGTKIDPKTMLSAVETGDRTINDRIASAVTNAQREQEIVQQNIAFANGLSEMVSKTGQVLGYSSDILHPGGK